MDCFGLARMGKFNNKASFAPVAQLDRAPDFESVGPPFESGRARHNINKLVMARGLSFFFCCTLAAVRNLFPFLAHSHFPLFGS